MRADAKNLRDIMEQSHLEVELFITVGGEPRIKKWEWKKTNDMDLNKNTP